MSFKNKMWVLSIIYSVVILVSIISYGVYHFQIEILGSSFFLFTTLYLSLRSYFLEYDKFFKELFFEFNKRYGKQQEMLNSINDFSDLNKNAEMKMKVNDYFDLCSEEYFWEKRGRIPNSVWLNWEKGMLIHLRKGAVKEFFNSEFLKGDSYYGWMTYIRKKI